MKQIILMKLNIVFTERDLKRIHVKEIDGKTIVVADVHGYSVIEGRRFFNNLLSLIHGQGIELQLIHGYNHGTALKEALRREVTDKKHSYEILIDEDIYNEGVTMFSFA